MRGPPRAAQTARGGRGQPAVSTRLAPQLPFQNQAARFPHIPGSTQRARGGRTKRSQWRPRGTGFSCRGQRGYRDSARLPAEAWGAGVPPTPLTTQVWAVRGVTRAEPAYQSSTPRAVPGMCWLPSSRRGVGGDVEGRGCHGTTSCSLWGLAFRAHPTAQTAARRPRPCQAPPTRGAIPRPRAWGSAGLCELLLSTGRAPGTPRGAGASST